MERLSSSIRLPTCNREDSLCLYSSQMRPQDKGQKISPSDTRFRSVSLILVARIDLSSPMSIQQFISRTTGIRSRTLFQTESLSKLHGIVVATILHSDCVNWLRWIALILEDTRVDAWFA